METPIIALRALRQKHRHLFSSEICPKARHVIQEKFKPDRLFGDATKREHSELPKKLDLYVAGFPCQVFSGLNSWTGNHKRPVRPLIHFETCVETIRACRPKAFVLENVPSLLSGGKGKYFASVVRALGALGSYRVSYMDLNSRNYGSAQNRRRLFIVGLHKQCANTALGPPPHSNRTKSFESIFEGAVPRKKPSKKTKAKLEACTKRSKHPVFVPINLLGLGCSLTRAPPCLLSKGEGVYWSKHKVVTTLREEMRLQGIPDWFEFPSGISDSAGRSLVGNGMSVDVLKGLLREIIRAIR